MRILPLDPKRAKGDAARALSSSVGHMTLFGLLAHAETTVLHVMRLGGAVLGKQKLDARTRELVVLLAIRMEGGRYEWPQHVEIARDAGVTAEQIEAIDRLDLHSAFDARDRDLLAFARAVVEDVRMEESVFANARRHLDEQEVVEAILAIGYYMMLVRLTEGLDVGPDPVQGRAVIRSLKR